MQRGSGCIWSAQGFLEEVMEEGWVLDGTIAQDSAQAAGIWGLREGVSVALKHAGAVALCPSWPSGQAGEPVQAWMLQCRSGTLCRGAYKRHADLCHQFNFCGINRTGRYSSVPPHSLSGM